MEIDLIEKLKEKDARFVTFCSGLNDKDAQDFDLQFFYSGIDEINEIIDDINTKIRNSEDSSEIQYLLTERILWMEERQAYYHEIDEIKNHLQNNSIFNENNSVFTEEERRKYSRLLQLVTMYDKLKSTLDIQKDPDKQVEVIHQFQNQLNLFYKNLFSTQEDLESKDVIPRTRLEGETLLDYQKYLTSFYDKSLERKMTLSNELNKLQQMKDYSFTFWKDVVDLENSSYFKLIEKHIPNQHQLEFLKSYITDMNEERFLYLKEQAKLADMEIHSPDLYQQSRDDILQHLNVLKMNLQKHDVHDLSVLSEVGIFSSLMQYLYLYEEKEKKQDSDLEDLKTKIDTYFQLLVHDNKKNVSLFTEEKNYGVVSEPDVSIQTGEAPDETQEFIENVTSFSDFMHEHIEDVSKVADVEVAETNPKEEQNEVKSDLEPITLVEAPDATQEFIENVTSFSDYMHEHIEDVSKAADVEVVETNPKEEQNEVKSDLEPITLVEAPDETQEFIENVTSFSDYMHEHIDEIRPLKKEEPVVLLPKAIVKEDVQEKVILSKREEMVNHFIQQLYEILSGLSSHFDKFQEKFSHKQPLTEEEWAEYNRLTKENELYFEELKRVQAFSHEDILNESIDLNIPIMPLTREDILLYLEASLPYSVPKKEVVKKNVLHQKMETYAKKIGSKGVKYTKKRKLPEKLFYEFRRSLNVVYSVVKPTKNFLQEYFASFKKNEEVMESQKVHIQDTFMVSFDTPVLINGFLDNPEYKTPLYSPDVKRVIEELIFYDEKNDAFLVARSDEEAFNYRKNGYRLFYVRAQDGIYKIEDVEKHLIHESGMKR